MLTEMQVRNAKGRDKDYKLADSDGLYLFVTAKGHRSWRMKYRFAGKERRLVLGAYPELIANMTQLPSGEWRALRNDKLWSLNTLLNSMTMARFRMSVEAMGYQVGDRSKHGNFEAAGIAARAVCPTFPIENHCLPSRTAQNRTMAPAGRGGRRRATREARRGQAHRHG